MEGKIKLEIMSPERPVFKGEVDSVTVPSVNGPFMVMDRTAPFIALLDVGVVRVHSGGGEEAFFISDGQVEVKDNTCMVLTNSAFNVKNKVRIDVAGDLATYRKDLKSAKTQEEKDVFQNHIRHLEMLLDYMDKKS